MKLKILIGALIFLIAVNLATIGSYLYLQWRAPRFTAAPPEALPPGPELRLDRAQQQQLRMLLRDFKQEVQPLERRVQELEERIFELLQKEPGNREVIEQHLQEISRLRFEISKRMLAKFEETREFLSPVQQKRFYDLLMRARPAPPAGRGPAFRRGPATPPHPAPFPDEGPVDGNEIDP